MNEDFKNISYLQHGNKKQQLAYDVLIKLNILNVLKKYSPLLVGTIPIEIDVDNSDLDIICEVENVEVFKALVRLHYSSYPQFKVSQTVMNDRPILTINFIADAFEIELYGENKVTTLQNGYRHMVVEYRLLCLSNERFRADIIALKQQGVKTEPAFAQTLKLKGNPYDAILRLEVFSDDELKKILHHHHY